MANSFKNYVTSQIGVTGQGVYTVPTGTTSVMIGCNVANVSTSTINIDVLIKGVYLVKGVILPAGSAISVLDGKVILEAGDTVFVESDTATSADVIVSVLEQT